MPFCSHRVGGWNQTKRISFPSVLPPVRTTKVVHILFWYNRDTKSNIKITLDDEHASMHTYNQNNGGGFPVPQDNHHDKGYLNIASSEPKIGKWTRL